MGGSATAATVASVQLRDLAVRDVRCPITGNKVCACDGPSTIVEKQISALVDELFVEESQPEAATLPHHRNPTAVAAAGRRLEVEGLAMVGNTPQSQEPLRAAGIVIFRRLPDSEQVQYLLVQSFDGSKGWTPPKGMLQTADENELAAAKRMALFETGLQDSSGYVIYQEEAVHSTSYWDALRKRDK